MANVHCIKNVLLATFALLFLAAPLSAATYYVDGPAEAAADTNDGSKDAPLKTIGAAVGKAAAGDTIVVQQGVYAELITITVSGTEEAPITLKAARPLAPMVLGFKVEGDYITIDGFEITCNGGGFGIDCGQAHMETARKGARILNNYIHDIEGTAITSGTHALVRGNRMRHVGRGVFVNSHTLVENNEVDTLRIQLNPKEGKLPLKKTQYAFFAGEHITFRGNYFHGAPLNRLTQGMGVDFFVTWDAWIIGPSHHILIENNRCFNATHASEVEANKLKQSSHITYRNNLFVNTVYVGVFPKYWSHIVVENNTFINCGAYPVWFRSKRQTEGAVVRNNLIAYIDHAPTIHGGPTSESGIRNDLAADPTATIDCDYNMFWGCENREYGEHDFVAEPEFVDPANGDYRLKAGSPGIDAGGPTKIKTDQLGRPRVRGKAVDIGAYEYSPE